MRRLGGGSDAVAELPAMRTWRYEVLGRVWHGWLAGMIAIVGDASSSQGVRLLPR